MKLQFLNTIPLEVISGGNIYNKTIIEGLRCQDIDVDYNTEPLNKSYDITIVDSLFMKDTSTDGLEKLSSIIAVLHQIPKLDDSTLDFYKTTAQFIVTGGETKENLTNNWQIKEERIKVIRPGISNNWQPKNRFRAIPGRVVIMANFVKDKGYRMLLAILENLKESSLEFHIIGNNTLDPKYSETVIRSIQKTKANVKFSFNISRDEVYDQLRKSDIFLSLSKSETFGMAIFEALSLGLPCLAYKAGDFSYFSEFSNYIMIEEYIERVFTETIEKLVNSSKTYKSYCNTNLPNRREWYQVIDEFSTHLKTMV